MTTVNDNIMRPYLHVGDEVEFEKGDPIPNVRICLIRYWSKEKVWQNKMKLWYKEVMMKRRNFITNSASVILSTGLVSCSVGLEGENTSNRQQQIKRGSGGGQSENRRSRTRVSGPTDLKSLSTILQRARCPLTESQINYLLTLKSGPEFNQKMNDVLDYKQIEAVKNASGGRGRGGGRRRR